MEIFLKQFWCWFFSSHIGKKEIPVDYIETTDCGQFEHWNYILRCPRCGKKWNVIRLRTTKKFWDLWNEAKEIKVQFKIKRHG